MPCYVFLPSGITAKHSPRAQVQLGGLVRAVRRRVHAERGQSSDRSSIAGRGTWCCASRGWPVPYSSPWRQSRRLGVKAVPIIFVFALAVVVLCHFLSSSGMGSEGAL